MAYNPFIQTEESIRVINSIKEIDEKVRNEKDADMKTKLMMEQMLRGLALQTLGVPNY
jgi:hypothetical protein